MRDYEIEEKKQAAADVLYQYSKFAMACIGNRVRPCDLRLHLMKVFSRHYTSKINKNLKQLEMGDIAICLPSSNTCTSLPNTSTSVTEISELPTSLKRESSQVAAPVVMGESSSSGISRLDKADSFRAL